MRLCYWLPPVLLVKGKEPKVSDTNGVICPDCAAWHIGAHDCPMAPWADWRLTDARLLSAYTVQERRRE